MLSPAPHLILTNFLNAESHEQLLAWTLANQGAFVPARVHTGVDEVFRRSLVLADIGPFQMPFALAARHEYKQWIAELGLPDFALTGVELELVAHNDGAHFSRHIDTEAAKGAPRALSAVYYFHREPKGFTGGELRIYPMNSTGEPDTFVSIEPVQNTMVIFPSFAPHRVMPVGCPSQDFADSRFAVNCWLHTKHQASGM